MASEKKAAGVAGKIALAAALAAAGVVIFSLILFQLIPARVYEARLQDMIRSNTGLTVSSATFSTAFPYDFAMEGVRVAAPGGRVMVRMDSLRMGFSPLGVLKGRPLSFEARSGGQGLIKGAACPLRGVLEVEATRVGLEAIPVLAVAGFRAGGAMDAALDVKVVNGCPEGSFKANGFEIRDAELTFRGIPLPVGDIEEAGAAVVLRGCKARVDGIWLESTDLSARLKGTVDIASPVSESAVDMTLEIVPREALLKKEFLISMLAGYRQSANYYSIPLKGTLGAIAGGR